MSPPLTTPIHGPNLQDARWGGYVPWFLRHPDFAVLGQFHIFFDRVAHRVKQFFLYGEGGSLNPGHVGAFIESESHQCFRFDSSQALAKQIRFYFSPEHMTKEEDSFTESDPPVIQKNRALIVLENKYSKDLSSLLKLHNDPAIGHAKEVLEAIRSTRRPIHRSTLVLARLTVLKSVLRHAPSCAGIIRSSVLRARRRQRLRSRPPVPQAT